MLNIGRSSPVTRGAGGALASILNYADGSHDNDCPAETTLTPGGRFILPVILIIILAVAALSLSPATAQLCGTLEDFPCGP